MTQSKHEEQDYRYGLNMSPQESTDSTSSDEDDTSLESAPGFQLSQKRFQLPPPKPSVLSLFCNPDEKLHHATANSPTPLRGKPMLYIRTKLPPVWEGNLYRGSIIAIPASMFRADRGFNFYYMSTSPQEGIYLLTPQTNPSLSGCPYMHDFLLRKLKTPSPIKGVELTKEDILELREMLDDPSQLNLMLQSLPADQHPQVSQLML